MALRTGFTQKILNGFVAGGPAKVFKALLFTSDPGTPEFAAGLAGTELSNANYTTGGEAFPNVTVDLDGEDAEVNGEDIDLGAVVSGVTHITYLWDTGTPATSPVEETIALGGPTDIQIIRFPTAANLKVLYPQA